MANECIIFVDSLANRNMKVVKHWAANSDASAINPGRRLDGFDHLKFLDRLDDFDRLDYFGRLAGHQRPAFNFIPSLPSCICFRDVICPAQFGNELLLVELFLSLANLLCPRIGLMGGVEAQAWAAPLAR